MLKELYRVIGQKFGLRRRRTSMSDKKKEHITCDDCGAGFKIEYDKEEELTYCPFCGADLNWHDDEEIDYWDEDEEPDYE